MNELNELNDKLLKEDIFWNIIEVSLKKSEDIDGQHEILISELKKMSLQEIISFKLRVSDLADSIHTDAMWCAGYLVNGGCSDDGFDYFKNWVVSRGKEVYYKVKENPDNLANYLDEHKKYLLEDEFAEFEELDYVAADAFENKTGKDLYDYLPTRDSTWEDFEPQWDSEDDESIKKLCPRLFEKVEY